MREIAAFIEKKSRHPDWKGFSFWFLSLVAAIKSLPKSTTFQVEDLTGAPCTETNNMAPQYYNFGVEIEVIVEPRNHGQPVPTTRKPKDNWKVWYKKLAAAMRNRPGIDQRHLRAGESMDRAYRNNPNRSDQWWITWDGSLVDGNYPKHPAVPLEAVSPKLPTNKRWEVEIDAFWDARRAVFYMPRRSARCGSHIHVSPGDRRFRLDELKAIGMAVLWYNFEVQDILHRSRRDADYCRPNITHSQMLQGKDIEEIVSIMNKVSNKADLVSKVQGWEKDDRATLWNFQNVTNKMGDDHPSSGTVEFRGGRGLRGPVRTKRWITFAIAFIIFAIEEFPLPLRSPRSRISTQRFWKKIRDAAAQVQMEQHLPPKYTTMNDNYRPDITEGVLDNGDESGTASDTSDIRRNRRFIPQSACNSLVNSDVEDS